MFTGAWRTLQPAFVDTGNPFIYYTANDGGGDDSRRICVLENESSNPMDGDWVWKGALDTPVPGLEDCIVFHALPAPGADTGLRETRIQKFEWNRDGTPDFGVPFSDDHALQIPSGEIQKIRE